MFAKIGIRSSQQFFEKRINLMGARVQWELNSMGAWNSSKQRKQRKSRGRKQKSERHQHQPYIFSSSWESRIAGGCRDVLCLHAATEKCGQPLVGGYRLGVGHICCKYRWNFFSIFMLLFGVNLRDESRKFKWECTILTISCFWQLQGVLAQAPCILGFVYFDVL